MRYLLDTNNMKEFNRVPGLKVENWIGHGPASSRAKRHI